MGARRTPMSKRPLDQLTADFHSKVDRSSGPNACWPWLAGRSMGYGSCYWERCGVRRDRRAHQISFSLANGGRWPDWAAKEVVRHTCNNRICCNPAHLIMGSIADNVADMVAAGDHDHGETHHNAKLTTADVIAIRMAHARGELQSVLAGQYGVGAPCINAICKRKTWRHVK